MKIVLLILIAITLASAADIDSLVSRSAADKDRARTIHGFVIKREVRARVGLNGSLTERKHFIPPFVIPNQVEYLNQRVDSLERVVSKITTVLENTQSHAEINTESINFVVKLVESLGALLGGLATIIGTIYAGYKFITRKKGD